MAQADGFQGGLQKTGLHRVGRADENQVAAAKTRGLIATRRRMFMKGIAFVMFECDAFLSRSGELARLQRTESGRDKYRFQIQAADKIRARVRSCGR
jgi:hypothetical protein